AARLDCALARDERRPGDPYRATAAALRRTDRAGLAASLTPLPKDRDARLPGRPPLRLPLPSPPDTNAGVDAAPTHHDRIRTRPEHSNSCIRDKTSREAGCRWSVQVIS